MTDQEVAEAVGLALDPEQGTPFTYGGRNFKFQFLTQAGEDALERLVAPRVKAAVESDEAPKDGLTILRDVLPEAMAIILRDYGEDVDLAWVRSARPAKIGESVTLLMYQVVSRQFEVNGLGKLLNALLLIAAQARLFATTEAA